MARRGPLQRYGRNTKTYLTLALFLLTLMGCIQVFFHSAYTQVLRMSMTDPMLVETLETGLGSPTFVYVLKNAYKTRRISIDDVFYKTAEARRSVKRSNKNQEHLLEHLMRSNLEAEILLVQVGEDLEILKHFSNGLNKMVSVNTTIVVFVLENYHGQIKSYIDKSLFLYPVVLLVNPYCSQLNPLWFPGDDPRDCYGNFSKLRLQKHEKCLNKGDADSESENRNARMTHKKHAWSWSVNLVYRNVARIIPFKGFVVNLDYSDILSPDSIHFLYRLHALRLSTCPECAISLISPWSELQLQRNSTVNRLAGLDEQNYSSIHLRVLRGSFLHGVSLSSTLWASMKRCAYKFCFHNDVSWRWSLTHSIRHSCALGKGMVLMPSESRLYTRYSLEHLSSRLCNITSLSLNETSSFKTDHGQYMSYKCDASKISEFIIGNLFNDHLLYPEALHANNINDQLVNALKFEDTLLDLTARGGWRDLRDQKLCHSNFLGLGLQEALPKPAFDISDT